MGRRSRKAGLEAVSRRMRFFSDWFPVLLGIVVVGALFWFGLQSNEWRHRARPPEASLTYVEEHFRDLIVPAAIRLDRWVYEPVHRYWRIEYRTSKDKSFMPSLIRELQARKYTVRSARENELFVEGPRPSGQKLIAILQWGKSTGRVTVHAAHVPQNERADRFWSQLGFYFSVQRPDRH